MTCTHGLDWARIGSAKQGRLSVGDLASEDPRSERVYRIMSSGPRVVWATSEDDHEQFIVPVSRLRWRARG